jgi:hypothetical protein
MGSVLAGWLESMLPSVKSDGELELDDATFAKGLNNAVKDNDKLFPPDWRLSYGNRKADVSSDAEELKLLRAQLEATQQQLRALEQRMR